MIKIDLGNSKAETKAALVANGSEKVFETSESLIFGKLNIPDFSATRLQVKFENDLSSDLVMTINTELDRLTISHFLELKDRFDDVYGKGILYKSFEYPYFDGDGHEVNAIKVNKGVYKCSWPVTTGAGRSLVMEIVQDGTIRVHYSTSEYKLPKKKGKR